MSKHYQNVLLSLSLPSTRFAPLLGVVFLFFQIFYIPVLASAASLNPLKEGKKVVEVSPLADSRIVLPDGKIHDVGVNLIQALKTKLFESNKWVVTEPKQDDDLEWQFKRSRQKSRDPSFIWSGGYSPAVTVKLTVEGFTFESGLRGNRMVYGFDDRFKTPFNDGDLATKEEFDQKPGEFGPTFEKKGRAPFDSLSGLDLGEGFEINVLFAWLKLKYAYYESWLMVNVHVESPVLGQKENRLLKIKGKGFFLDLAGSYAQYSAEIAVGRTDAVLQALKKAVSRSTQAVYNMMGDVPLTAKIDAVQDGLVFLGTGRNAEIPIGTRYQSVSNPSLLVQVQESTPDGSIAHPVGETDLNLIQIGSVFVEEGGLGEQIGIDPQARGTSVSKSLQLGEPVSQVIEASGFDNLPGLPDQQAQFQSSKDQALAWLKKISELVFLPYRIYRYFKYDQPYRQKSDVLGRSKAKELGTLLAQIPLASESSNQVVPRIAVIDSGVDYNHPALHGSLWINESPQKDLRGRLDRYGWDFVGGDARPFDDHYHGTQTAYSVVLGAARAGSRVQIMPLKVFNPWGITRSASLYAAFEYAIAHGAHAIVCAWSTSKETESLREAVALAVRAQVPVFVSAGDEIADIKVKAKFPSSLRASLRASLRTQIDSETIFVVGAAQDKKSASGYSPEWVDVGVEVSDKLQIAEPRGGWIKAKKIKSQASIGVGYLAGQMMSEWMLHDFEAGRLPQRLDWERFIDGRAKSQTWAQDLFKSGRVIRVE